MNSESFSNDESKEPAATRVVHELSAPDCGERTSRRIRIFRSGGYDVCHTHGGMSEVAELLANSLRDRRALVVTTPTVNRSVTKPLLAECAVRLGRHLPTLVLPCSERQKTQETASAICSAALQADLDRAAVLIAIGGGVCSDLTTVAAASIRRGLSHIRVPTTLIGLVDAGIGVKGSLNFEGRKSYLGCYFPPELVLVNQGFLAGLPMRHFLAGVAEIVKMAIVADEGLFAILEREPPLTPEHFASHSGNSRTIVWRSIVSMLDELEPNLFEDQTNERLADFGHTFSPNIENTSGFAVLHGEAVAIDIALSTELAACLGILSDAARSRIINLLRRFALPTFTPLLTLEQCVRSMDAMRSQRGGHVNLILPRAIGRGLCVADSSAVPHSALREALRRLSEASAVP